MRKVGDSMGFTGGAEETPIVNVVRFISGINSDSFPSMNDGKTTLEIHQGNVKVQVSPETLQAILNWYKS